MQGQFAQSRSSPRASPTAVRCYPTLWPAHGKSVRDKRHYLVEIRETAVVRRHSSWPPGLDENNKRRKKNEPWSNSAPAIGMVTCEAPILLLLPRT